MLNALQTGPSYGEGANVWRVACVASSTGTRVSCNAPFATCLAPSSGDTIAVDTTDCAQATTDFAVDCTCPVGQVAISGGAYSSQPGDMLNASQAGPSFGESAQVWRVACVDPTGTRVPCSQPFAVCLSAASASSARIETASCTTGSLGVDCTCAANEVAVAGGAYASAPYDMLETSQAGPAFGDSPRTWRLACVNPSGTAVTCSQPFAVCLAVP
jgi:hypothetical protein